MTKLNATPLGSPLFSISTALTTGTTHYWNVAASDSTHTTTSYTRHFATGGLPGEPEGLMQGDDHGNPGSIELVWNGVPYQPE